MKEEKKEPLPGTVPLEIYFTSGAVCKHKWVVFDGRDREECSICGTPGRPAYGR